MADSDRGDDFELIAKWSRGGGRSADPSELVLQRRFYEGHEYLDLRVFDLATGKPRPTNKGTSIRIREARALAEALLRAVPPGDDQAPPAARSAPAPDRPRNPPRRQQYDETPLLPKRTPATVPIDPDDDDTPF